MKQRLLVLVAALFGIAAPALAADSIHVSTMSLTVDPDGGTALVEVDFDGTGLAGEYYQVGLAAKVADTPSPDCSETNIVGKLLPGGATLFGLTVDSQGEFSEDGVTWMISCQDETDYDFRLNLYYHGDRVATSQCIRLTCHHNGYDEYEDLGNQTP